MEKKDLQIVRSIDTSSFQCFFWDSAQGSGQDHHGEAGLDPDQDDHQKYIVPKRNLQPNLWLHTQAVYDGVQDTDLLAFARTIIIDKFPDHRCANKGDGHRHKDQRFGNIAPPEPVSHDGNDKTKDRCTNGHNDQPQ